MIEKLKVLLTEISDSCRLNHICDGCQSKESCKAYPDCSEPAKENQNDYIDMQSNLERIDSLETEIKRIIIEGNYIHK